MSLWTLYTEMTMEVRGMVDTYSDLKMDEERLMSEELQRTERVN